MLGHRSNDAVLTICQNNLAKSIEIRALNQAAEESLGYQTATLMGKKLVEILPARIAELLNEYVEYDNENNEVGTVLAKVQSFSVIDKQGREVGYRLKVVRAESSPEATVFQLVLHDTLGQRKNEAVKRAIQENFKGHEVIDKETGLPDRYSLGKDIELMGYYNSKSELNTCFAAVQIDNVDALVAEHGELIVIALMKHMAQVCRQNLRPDDVVGVLVRARIGLLLLDTSPESARMVLNRLRWQIAANPYVLPDKTPLGVGVSISFKRVGDRVAGKELMEACDQAIDALGAKAVNALVEVS